MLKLEQKEIIGVAALLIHAAKIDEIYSEKEKNIILNFIKKNIKKVDLAEEFMKESEKLEENSNQLLSFTKIIKESDTQSVESSKNSILIICRLQLIF